MRILIKAYKILVILPEINYIYKARLSPKRKFSTKHVLSTHMRIFIAFRCKLTSLSKSTDISISTIGIPRNCYHEQKIINPSESNLNRLVFSTRTNEKAYFLALIVMTSHNSPNHSEDDLLDVDESYEAIDIDVNVDTLELSVTDQEIADISNSAASLDIANIQIVHINKRPRENSKEDSLKLNESLQRPPTKKIKKVIMAPPELPDAPIIPAKFLVRLVPDIDDVHLFSKGHLDMMHTSVLKAHKEANDPNIKFDFCKPERGRYKFVCPNEETRQFANNIVPLLKNLWKDPKIKSIDFGEVPKMIRGAVTFDNPPPEMLDFFENVDLLNDTIDTNDWSKPARGNKTTVFIGMDEESL